MEDKIKVVHYINQFFAGLGGEKKADAPLQQRSGPVGPGLALEQALGEKGKVVETITCGDNFFHDNAEKVTQQIADIVARANPDVFIAGPAFDAGRYGLACGECCQRVSELVKIPAITGMHPENPVVEAYRRKVYIVETSRTSLGMAEAVGKMARIAAKLARGESLTPDDGCIPRGARRNVLVPESAAQRAVAMLHRKLKGEPFKTEIPLLVYERVTPAPPVQDLAAINLALVTEGGIVPRGNPDKIEYAWATKWRTYSLSHVNDLIGEEYEAVHGGYDSTYANQDPDRILPLDVLRELEKEGVIGKLLDHYYITVGNGMPVENCHKVGVAMARELLKARVSGAIVTAT